MAIDAKNWYRAHEFAQLVGVTVRTLHHYDRVGLLKPKRYTAAGHRLYGAAELAHLQQILTLKWLGLTLTQIKEVLSGREFALRETLRLQRAVITGRRRQLDLALQAIEQAEHAMTTQDAPDWEAFRKITEVMNMSDMEWTQKYYTEEAQQKLAERRAQWTPEMQQQMEQSQKDWAVLIAEAETAVAAQTDPASPTAQNLAARWQQLITAFTGGDTAIRSGLNNLYADQGNWPASFKKPYSDEVGAFMGEAMALMKK